MEIKNLQTVLIGNGKHTFNAYLTLDLIPFHLIVKYDTTYKKVDFGWGVGGYELAPEYISNFYTKDIYQSVINMLCKKFELEPRELVSFGRHRDLPFFDFKEKKHCYEYQYTNAFHLEFYTKTKIQNALKAHGQLYKTHESFDRKNLDGDFQKMYFQIDEVIKQLKRQKVFTNRDYFDLSHATIDRFINNLPKKKKVLD